MKLFRLYWLYFPQKIGWIGLAAVSGLRINEDYIVWPDKSSLDTLNATDPRRYVSKSTADTYMVIVLKIQIPYICNTVWPKRLSRKSNGRPNAQNTEIQNCRQVQAFFNNIFLLLGKRILSCWVLDTRVFKNNFWRFHIMQFWLFI